MKKIFSFLSIMALAVSVISCDGSSGGGSSGGGSASISQITVTIDGIESVYIKGPSDGFVNADGDAGGSYDLTNTLLVAGTTTDTYANYVYSSSTTLERICIQLKASSTGTYTTANGATTDLNVQFVIGGKMYIAQGVSPDSSSASITISAFGALGEYIEGTFTATGKASDNSTKAISGTFVIKRLEPNPPS